MLVSQLHSTYPLPLNPIQKEELDTPSLEVTQYHYLAWPDHGVPANAISMINFIKRVRKAHPYSRQDLLVVHCSAGVGRTGTFITLDYMLERIKAEKTINIYDYVSELRKQRVLMVQTVVSDILELDMIPLAIIVLLFSPSMFSSMMLWMSCSHVERQRLQLQT